MQTKIPIAISAVFDSCVNRAKINNKTMTNMIVVIVTPKDKANLVNWLLDLHCSFNNSISLFISLFLAQASRELSAAPLVLLSSVNFSIEFFFVLDERHRESSETDSLDSFVRRFRQKNESQVSARIFLQNTLRSRRLAALFLIVPEPVLAAVLRVDLSRFSVRHESVDRLVFFEAFFHDVYSAQRSCAFLARSSSLSLKASASEEISSRS